MSQLFQPFHPWISTASAAVLRDCTILYQSTTLSRINSTVKGLNLQKTGVQSFKSDCKRRKGNMSNRSNRIVDSGVICGVLVLVKETPASRYIPMIRWTPAFWRMRLEKHDGFHEMPIASMKSRLRRASCTLACITGSMGSCRSYSRLSRKSRVSKQYALVPLTRSEPDADVSMMEHRQKVDDILRAAWRGIDGYAGNHWNDWNDCWLVGALEHFTFSHILGIIIPIDFHNFSEGLLKPPISWAFGDEDGGFKPTTYGELTPSGARHLARAMGIDHRDARPFGGNWQAIN